MRKVIPVILLTILWFAPNSSVFASGFAVIEQSVKGLGTAQSGSAAKANDASTVFFNPAGMAHLEGQHATFGVHYILPVAKFSGSVTNTVGTQVGAAKSEEYALAPNGYFAQKLSEQWAVGFGINAPFGLSTIYDAEWIGRYHAVETTIMALNLNPAISYRVGSKLSLGLGVNLMYMDGTLSQAIDFGSATGVSALAANSVADVFSEINIDGWGYGYNVGAMYFLNDDTRFGVSYRSGVEQDLKGGVKFKTPDLDSYDPVLTVIADMAFPNQNVSTDVDLPASAQLSVYHQVNSSWAIMADVMWTDWSRFDELTIKFADGLQGGAITETTEVENWKDTWRYSIGTSYSANDSVTLRGGLAFDNSPTVDQYRNPRLPGNDRVILSAGVGYLNGPWSIDFGYSHQFIDDGSINLVDKPENGVLSGTFDCTIDYFSLEASYRF